MSRFQRKRQKLVARSMRELLTEISNCDFSKWEKFDVINDCCKGNHQPWFCWWNHLEG